MVKLVATENCEQIKNQSHIYVFCGWKFSIFVLSFSIDPPSQMENNDLVRKKKDISIVYSLQDHNL